MKTLLDTEQVNKAIRKIAEQIKSDIPPNTDIAVIGIRSRGEILAQRLNDALGNHFSGQLLSGTLDITLYRDDLNEPKETQPTVRSTEIDFDITDKLILLVDDVIRGLVLKTSDSVTIKTKGVNRGMTTLRDDGIRKALEGTTTIEEVVRVTQQ